MVSILFVWVMMGGQIHLEGSETFYTLEACQAAARAAENAPLTFINRPEDIQVRGICSTKRLAKDERK